MFTPVRITIVSIFTLICVAMLYYGGMFGSRTGSGSTKPDDWEPDQVPEIMVQDLNGRQVSLRQFKGKIVILNFWATWCPPCVKEFPSMLQLVKDSGGEVVLVAVSHDDSIPSIHRFLQGFKSQYSAELSGPSVVMAWDEQQKIARDQFGIIRLPETIILDKKQRMIKKYAGAVNWVGPEVKALIGQLARTNQPAK